MKKWSIGAVLLALLLVFLGGCQAPRDPNVLYDEPLTEELKEKLSKVLKMNYDYIDPNYGSPIHGRINDCIIIRVPLSGLGVYPEQWRFEVAGYMFEWLSSGFGFWAYRDGEVCRLEDAYENGWLTEKQIEAIHAKNHAFYEKRIQSYRKDFPYSTEYDNYINREALSEQMKEEISDALLAQCGTAVDWNCPYTFYGKINGCAVFMTAEQTSDRDYHRQDLYWDSRENWRSFEWLTSFELYAYRDGEVCELQEAIDREWLKGSHICVLREINVEYYVARYYS